jgi:hypothetical protein
VLGKQSAEFGKRLCHGGFLSAAVRLVSNSGRFARIVVH